MNTLLNPAMATGWRDDRPAHAGDAAAAEARRTRAALHLAAQLSLSADALPHDISERLRFGRMRALDVARARSASAAAAAPPRPSGWSSWAFRLGAVAPLVTLVVGLVTIERGHTDSQIVAAAEVDTALLADELPPAAYSDPGFSEFLRSSNAN